MADEIKPGNIMPLDRNGQADHIMVLAGEALMNGDRPLWLRLYRESLAVRDMPEVGSDEWFAENRRIERMTEEALRG